MYFKAFNYVIINTNFYVQGLLRVANHSLGCVPLDPPPPIPEGTSPEYAKWVVLIRRHNCTYVEKVLNAQAAGYAAVIVMNVGSNFIGELALLALTL